MSDQEAEPQDDESTEDSPGGAAADDEDPLEDAPEPNEPG